MIDITHLLANNKNSEWLLPAGFSRVYLWQVKSGCRGVSSKKKWVMKMKYGEVKKLREKMSNLCRSTMAFFMKMKRSGRIIREVGNTASPLGVVGASAIGSKQLEHAIWLITRLYQAQSETQSTPISRLNPFLVDLESVFKLGSNIKLGRNEETAMRQYLASLTMHKNCPNKRRQLLVKLTYILPRPIRYNSRRTYPL